MSTSPDSHSAGPRASKAVLIQQTGSGEGLFSQKPEPPHRKLAFTPVFLNISEWRWFSNRAHPAKPVCAPSNYHCDSGPTYFKEQNSSPWTHTCQFPTFTRQGVMQKNRTSHHPADGKPFPACQHGSWCWPEKNGKLSLTDHCCSTIWSASSFLTPGQQISFLGSVIDQCK